jgi:hypothetical protein
MERWGRDSEYVRLLDDEPCQLLSSRQWQKWLEDITSGKEFFVIRVNENDRPVSTKMEPRRYLCRYWRGRA